MRGWLGFSPTAGLAGVALVGEEPGSEEAAVWGAALEGALFER